MTIPMTKAERTADEQEIAATVSQYYNGYAQADFDQLDRAFAARASMFGVTINQDGEEEFGVWPDIGAVIKRWSANENPPRDLACEILHLSVVDGRIATVHLKFGDGYFDALTLVKVKGAWEIAAKVFVLQ